VCVSDAADTGLLYRQQLRLGLLKAVRVILNSQENLRLILSQQMSVLGIGPQGGAAWLNDTLQDITECESFGEDPTGDIGISAQHLFHYVMQAATQPSPVKAIFTRDDLDAAALAAIQHLTAIEASQPRSYAATSTDLTTPKVMEMSHLFASADCASSSAQSSDQPVRKSRLEHKLKIRPVKESDSLPSVSSSLFSVRPLVAQIMEMGFPRRRVELAMKQLGIYIVFLICILVLCFLLY